MLMTTPELGREFFGSSSGIETTFEGNDSPKEDISCLSEVLHECTLILMISVACADENYQHGARNAACDGSVSYQIQSIEPCLHWIILDPGR